MESDEFGDNLLWMFGLPLIISLLSVIAMKGEFYSSVYNISYTGIQARLVPLGIMAMVLGHFIPTFKKIKDYNGLNSKFFSFVVGFIFLEITSYFFVVKVKYSIILYFAMLIMCGFFQYSWYKSFIASLKKNS